MENYEFNQEPVVIEEPKKSAKGLGIGSLICSILGGINCIIPLIYLVAPILSIVGIILGSIGIKRAKENGESAGLAKAGLIIGIIALILDIGAIACTLILAGTGALGSLMESFN